MFDLDADLDTFFNTDEFSVAATIQLPTGPLDIAGIPSRFNTRERPGSNTNSGRGAFMVGVADFNLRSMHLLTPAQPIAAAVSECLLTIAPGNKYSGTYRVRAIERDGEIARLRLNMEPA